MSKASHYREAHRTETPTPPRVLEVPWRDAQMQTHAVVVLQVAVLGSIVVALVAAVHWLAAVVLALVFVALGRGYVRERTTVPTLRCTLDEGQVCVEFGDTIVCTLPLTDVHQVELDRYEHSKVTLHQNAGDPMLSSQVSAAVDVARIVIVRENGERVPLTTSYGSYNACTEAFSKLRVLLRKHGWLPPDERNAAKG